jgi:hypothetical protein
MVVTLRVSIMIRACPIESILNTPLQSLLALCFTIVVKPIQQAMGRSMVRRVIIGQVTPLTPSHQHVKYGIHDHSQVQF